MAAKRSPKRDKAFEIWRDSNKTIPPKEIAKQLEVTETLVRKWKCQDKWDEKINSNITNQSKGNITKRGAPKGNKNSVGHGAPKANKNAVTTGAYETIWMDCLTDKEKALCETINTDMLAQIEEELWLITIRERRMMERIQRLMDGLTEKERKILQELQIQKNPVEVYDEKTGTSKVVIIPEAKMVITEITEVECRKIDDILKVEQALTQVQEKKARLIMVKHKIVYDNEVLNLRERELKLKEW
ncbi:Phage terminase small subunit [Sporomusa ovata DSM 2662]|uniref:Phage terminase, small subunit n=1 Tax=Sporomusa ovata TaxID=2378 RepID=A0A0U1L0W4_9FIRM|nr:phage terminase small subunit [Sporomusa ovata]EQB27473.1 hypothetical protein SOV_2c03690 [Sporomusa ovata DSM 2662]CQR73317.1 Phage terminase, small subunit [Sporomusa ovata]